MSEEALQIAERREAKGKGERERNTQLNAEFQRRAKRDFKKAFLNEQCKEIQENNRMGETSDLFRKIRDTKISRKDEHNKGQKRQGLDRSRKDKEMVRIHRRTIRKRS